MDEEKLCLGENSMTKIVEKNINRYILQVSVELF